LGRTGHAGRFGGTSRGTKRQDTFFVWLVFFRLKLLQRSIAWGVVSAFVGLHVLLVTAVFGG
jgi:hypothetical protein